MSIDIAAMSDAQKLAYAKATGSVLLDSGTITSPVEFIDLTLPSGYVSFKIVGNNFVAPYNSTIAGAVSIDGGSTFFCDGTNFDTYGAIRSASWIDDSNAYNSSFNGDKGRDSLMYLTDTQGTAGDGADFYVDFAPGSVSKGFRAGITGYDVALDASAGLQIAIKWNNLQFLNPAPIAGAPTLGRVNVFRFMPYGTGDCPPTSGNTINAGSYFLFGLATP